MTTYARVLNGRLLEEIAPAFDEAGQEIDIQLRFHPDFVASLVVYDPAAYPPPEPPPPPTHAELLKQAITQIRQERQPILGVLDGLQASYITKDDKATAIVIEVAKQALRDITKVDLSACETLAEMKAVVLARYAQIASASPALKSAFTQAVT